MFRVKPSSYFIFIVLLLSFSCGKPSIITPDLYGGWEYYGTRYSMKENAKIRRFPWVDTRYIFSKKGIVYLTQVRKQRTLRFTTHGDSLYILSDYIGKKGYKVVKLTKKELWLSSWRKDLKHPQIEMFVRPKDKPEVF